MKPLGSFLKHTTVISIMSSFREGGLPLRYLEALRDEVVHDQFVHSRLGMLTVASFSIQSAPILGSSLAPCGLLAPASEPLSPALNMPLEDSFKD